jgi:hypothetical protein
VRNLNVIEEDDVLKLGGVAYYAVGSHDRTSSDESALSYLCLWSDDAGSLDISRIEYSSALGDPDILTLLLIYFRIECGADLLYKLGYLGKNFPGILLSFKKRCRVKNCCNPLPGMLE